MKTNRPILQAPWRTHRQRVGMVLLAIVGASMVAALYLSVASQSTLIGREIQTLEREIGVVKEENANLKSELARLLSYRATEARGDALGFRAATAEETDYLIVPGYKGKNLTRFKSDDGTNSSIRHLPSEYSQSLFDWFDLNLR